MQQIGAGSAFLALLLMLSQLAAALMPLTIVFSHTLSKRILTGVAIEQGFLMFRPGQQLVRMLAVNLDKQLAELTKLRKRDGGTVNKTAGAPVGTDDAAK